MQHFPSLSICITLKSASVVLGRCVKHVGGGREKREKGAVKGFSGENVGSINLPDHAIDRRRLDGMRPRITRTRKQRVFQQKTKAHKLRGSTERDQSG